MADRVSLNSEDGRNLQGRLRSHLEAVTRERDPRLASQGHFYVQQYIRQELSRWGEVEIDAFVHGVQPGKNLILKLPAASETKRDRPPILVGAHYDGVPGSPAADDNATGVAVLLELARSLAATPVPQSFWFVAFDLEEWGMVGGQHLAERCRAEGQRLRLMLSLEMLGYCDPTPGSQQYPAPFLERIYPNRGDFIALVGNGRALWPLRRLQRVARRSHTPCELLIVPNAGRPIPAVRLSDHSPFWDCGYAAAMVTDTSFLRNPHYHLPSDTMDTLDLDFLTRTCQSLDLGLRSLS